MIRALIFDFDGMIVDTEMPDFQAWQEIYQSYGVSLAFSDWLRSVGALYESFDPYIEIEAQLGRVIDREQIGAAHLSRWTQLAEAQPSRPGIRKYIIQASQRGLKLGIASNAKREWATGHLARLDLDAYFDCIRTVEDAPHAKPAPDLYLSVLDNLGLHAGQAIAFEDSKNGITAAKQAGLFCVAVPNPATQHLDLSAADLLLESLAEMPLMEMLSKAGG